MRRRVLILCVLALAAPVTAGAATLVARRDAGRPAWVQPDPVGFDPALESALDPALDPAAAPSLAPDPPTRLRIPRLGVDTALERLALDASGALASPKEFGRAGWFADGTLPGDPGPAVIAGHVDSRTGPAVFYKLHDLRAGDVVEVQRGAAWLAFTVTATEHYAKAEFPSAKVYGPTPGPELRLITCGGEFDERRRSYRDNVVVYAVMR